MENLEYRIQFLEGRVAENEEKNAKVHKEFYDRLDSLGRFEAVTADRYATLLKTIESVAADLKAIKENPGKKWQRLIDTSIAVVVTAVVTSLLTGISF